MVILSPLCNHAKGDVFVMAQHFNDGVMEPRVFLIRFGNEETAAAFRDTFKALKASADLEEVEDEVEQFTQATQCLHVPTEEETFEEVHDVYDLVTGEILEE